MDRLRYKNGWLAYIEAGIGSPAIMLVPDAAVDHRSLLPLFSLLSTRYRTVALDLPGSGESIADQTDPTDRTDPVDPESQAAALHWLRRQLGLGRVVFVGDGDGSLVTTRAAEADSRRVYALIRVGPVPETDPTPPQLDGVPCLDLADPSDSTMAAGLTTAPSLGGRPAPEQIIRSIERFLDELKIRRASGGAP